MSPNDIENQNEDASQRSNETQEQDATQQAKNQPQTIEIARLRIAVDQYQTVQQARMRMWNRRLALSGVHEVSPDTFEVGMASAELMKKAEEKYRTYFGKAILEYPVYVEFLSKVRGIGAVLSAELIGYIRDIRRFGQVSSLWHYAGFHVENGQAVKLSKGKEVTWNPALKAICWNVGASFVRSGHWYRLFYDETKPKEASKHNKMKCPRGKECSEKLHVDNRTRRKVVKMFLSHLWEAWRELEGLPVTKPYPIAYLGHKDFVSWKDVVKNDSEAK